MRGIYIDNKSNRSCFGPMIWQRKAVFMALRETQMDNYARMIKIYLMGKSDEAKGGASLLVQALLRYANGVKGENRTFDTMLEMLNKLNTELPS